MRVKVTRVILKNQQAPKVDFETALGESRVSWMDEPPTVGGIYDIEMEIPATLTWGTTILPSQAPSYRLKREDHSLSLTGLLEPLEAGLASLRVGNDLMLIATAGEPRENLGLVDIVTDQILAYDLHL